MSDAAATPAISKRRAGAALGGQPVADPRPRLAGDRVEGWRCDACGHPVAQQSPWCPKCASPELKPAVFGPDGTVWAGTVVHLPVGRRRPPFALAYVDLDDGPRVLAHVTVPVALRTGSRARIVGGDDGDVLVEPQAGQQQEGTA
jgi:uncharacterized OB-fold protein